MKILLTAKVILLALCTSCGPGAGDVRRELSGGYAYRVEGSGARLLGPGKQIYPKIIAYDFDSSFILIAQKPSRWHYKEFFGDNLLIRYPFFVGYENGKKLDIPIDYLKKYMFRDSAVFRHMQSKGISTTRSGDDYYKVHTVVDSLFEHDPYYIDLFSRQINYWIVSHKEQNPNDYIPMSGIYGPYSEKVFLEKRKELGVPADLQLKIDKVHFEKED